MKTLRLVALVLLSAMAGMAAAQVVPLNGSLGANFNGEYQDVNFSDLRNAHAHWLRGFLNMTEVNPRTPSAELAISTTLSAEADGFHTIFTLKWPFQHSGIPAANSQRYRSTLEDLDSVLPLVMGKVDIIEIGNEPYWETPAGQRGRQLNEFYEAMARLIITYRKMHCGAHCRTHLFMGALNRLNRPEVRNAEWVKRWLAFARATPEIDGIDIHPHVDSLAASRPFVDYTLKHLRPNQKFLATEFSLVWNWKSHMNDPVPADFARKYDLSAGLKMWQAIAAATKNPFSQQKWNDLLEHSPWFAEQSQYIDRQVALFRSTGRFAVACYGFEQGVSMTRKFGHNSVPWLLNSVYARRTVRAGVGVNPPTNPYWLASFRKLNQ